MNVGPWASTGTSPAEIALGVLAGEEPTATTLDVALVPGTTTGPAPR